VSEPAITTHRLAKTFRDFWGRPRVCALRGLDLEVRRGEALGLLGPNGSGKSTTIKLLVGLLHPTRGTARVLGALPRDVRAKARLGYLPEEGGLYQHLTAEEALLFSGRLFSIPRPELRRRAAELLSRVGLSGAAGRRIGEFSKGMLRRIGLAQALINEPDLLILDEPAAGLDPLGTREFKDLIRELKARGKTVLLSSHLLADVEDVCDRVAVLHQGSLIALGEVAALLKDDHRTQIITGRLAPETIDALVRFLKEREGAGLEVEVGAPADRLETFFLRVVAEAGGKAGDWRLAAGGKAAEGEKPGAPPAGSAPPGSRP
jgi:ABC-2 type transport system ATP-binding protein